MSSGSLVLGVLDGMTFGLLAIGLVLVYKSNRFLNLAHGQMGALSASILGKLVIDDGWNWWVAFVVCVPIGVAVAVAIDRFVIRPLRERNASSTTLLLVTIGVTQVLIGVSLFQVVQPDPNKYATKGYPLPFQAHIRLGGVVLNGADVLIAIAVPLIVVALALFLRGTGLGRSIRAAASNPDEARLCGISTRFVSMVTWALAGGLSALTAIIVAPGQSSTAAAGLGPDLLFLALGAAALAAFSSIPLAMVGGILIGVAQQLTLAATSKPSDAELVVFLLVVAIVILRGRAIGHVFAVTGAAVEERAPLRISDVARKVPWVQHRNRLSVGVAALIALLLPLLPALNSESDRFRLALLAVYALAAMSLTVAVGWAGQVSLGHFALVGAGAFIAARLLNDGWSLPFVVLPVGLVGAGLMMAVGIPALRVPGLTLSVTTLGFAIVGQDWLFRQGWFGTTQSVGITLGTPHMARGLGRPGGQIVVYYFGCVLVAVAAWFLVTLRRSQPGRVLIAVRDNSPAAAAFGVRPDTTKMVAIGLSGFLAAAAGVVWADAWRDVAMSQFPPEASFTLLALPVIGGIGSVAGAAAAAVLFYGASFLITPHLTWLFGSLGNDLGFQLLFAGVALIVTILRVPSGLAGAVQRWMQNRLDRISEDSIALTVRPERPALRAAEMMLSFGGIQALAGASIEVGPGEIVGLIGPNGAGKTTLLNVISGTLRADSGQVWLGPVDLSDLPPELRSAYGLARSFQNARLFPGLTVTEALQVARYNHFRPSLLSAGTSAPWIVDAESQNRQVVDEVIDRLGLRPWADHLTAELSTGTRRICDLAAQLVARPSVLLLDEPTAGVAQREAEAFGPLLRRIRDELDCSILIVEHDMPLLMGLCDRVYAMELGRVIASGSPEEVRHDPAVVASYLGTDETAIARSGPNAGKPKRTRRKAQEEPSSDPTTEMPQVTAIDVNS
ncbi:MAG TPA: branched-chain amino acid ABC transporter permease/ATP-binding protein [Acidimicrobiales bacterium]|nr:branched-chain amino acid ABC transporter permease/ATP-binding protein [Acidimicrobiales bacterium]